MAMLDFNNSTEDHAGHGLRQLEIVNLHLKLLETLYIVHTAYLRKKEKKCRSSSLVLKTLYVRGKKGEQDELSAELSVTG